MKEPQQRTVILWKCVIMFFCGEPSIYEVCLLYFVMLRSTKLWCTCHTIGTIGKPSMSRIALCWIYTLWAHKGEVIEHWTIFSPKTESFKSKLKIKGEFEHAIGIVGELLVSKI